MSWAPNVKKYNAFKRSTKEEEFLRFLIFNFLGSKCKKITPQEGVQKRREFLRFLFGGAPNVKNNTFRKSTKGEGTLRFLASPIKSEGMGV